MANLSLAIPYIMKWEGGLSRAATDSASKNPSPYEYNGKTGWHTNKGITWATFKDLALKLGYAISAVNFLQMPEFVWRKIYENGYWLPMQCDKIESEAIATAIVDYAWAFGFTGAKKRIVAWIKKDFNITVSSMSQVANFLNKQPESVIFKKLIEHRKQAFNNLNQPKNIKGWLNRMNDLEVFGNGLIKKKSQSVTPSQ